MVVVRTLVVVLFVVVVVIRSIRYSAEKYVRVI